MNLVVPCSSIIMLAISLANLRMRTVSQDGAFPPCSGRFAVPVLYMELSWFDRAALDIWFIDVKLAILELVLFFQLALDVCVFLKFLQALDFCRII